MKRNHLPEGDEFQNEKEIIGKRLSELFSRSDERYRQVQIFNKGTWIPSRKHISLESNKGLSADMLSYSVEHEYHFLNPFEALFCVESRQLIVHFNGLPLSLAECYQLLLQDEVDFRNYIVFQHLNRLGHICLRHSCSPPAGERQVPDHIHRSQRNSPASISITNLERSKDEPLLELDTIQLPMSEVLTSLQKFGPVDANMDAVATGSDSSEAKLVDDGGGGGVGVSVDITFDVYKRETFARNKPHKGKRGDPDYHVLVCERSIHGHPMAKQVLDISRERGKLSEKLLYALVNDEDNSICFNQFKPVDSLDLVGLQR